MVGLYARPAAPETEVGGIEGVAGGVDVVDDGAVGAADVIGVGRIVVGQRALRHRVLRIGPRPADLVAGHNLGDGIHLEEAVVSAVVDLPEHPGPPVVGPVGLLDAAGVVDVDRLARVGPVGQVLMLEAVAR